MGEFRDAGLHRACFGSGERCDVRREDEGEEQERERGR